MLSKAKALKGYQLDSLDGEFGEVKEFYFDDRHWTIRYLVANTGNWLTGRQVLISPYALVAAIKAERHIAVDLTKKQIENSPALDSDKPVSRQFEEAYYDHYGWPLYWSGPYMWGSFPIIPRDRETWKPPAQGEKAWDAHLRSTDNVCGYEIQAIDGELGPLAGEGCSACPNNWRAGTPAPVGPLRSEPLRGELPPAMPGRHAARGQPAARPVGPERGHVKNLQPRDHCGGKRDRRVTPAAEWLLDNFYLIEEQIQMARRHLPRGYSRELPRLLNSPSAGLPRVYDIVLELISHVDAQIDAGAARAFVAAYQTVVLVETGRVVGHPDHAAAGVD
jgi:hypothetical protein